MVKIEHIEEPKEEIEVARKSVSEEEDRQLLWLVIVVGFVFVAVLFSYFWVQGAKSFQYDKINWTINDYNNLKIFHGRFPSLGVANLTFNMYLREDPRKNNAQTNGTFDKFSYGGIVSISPTIDRCRGELSRAMLDLGSFMRRGIGVGPLEVATTDKFTALELNRTYARCDTVSDKTIVIVEMGNSSSVVQNTKNPYCYTIKAQNCEDISSIEKFMVKSVDDYRSN